jgi:hypothetical protein
LLDGGGETLSEAVNEDASGEDTSASALTEADEFRVTIAGPGFKLDRPIDGNVVAQITALVFGGAAFQQPAPYALGRRVGGDEVVDLDHDGGDTQQSGGRAIEQTLGEYLEEVAPKTVVDKITAVGEFLYLNEDMQDFSTEDFKRALLDIRDDVPKNISRDFSTALQSRYISKAAGSDKRYFVTKTGRAALENHFPRPARKRSASSKPAK